MRTGKLLSFRFLIKFKPFKKELIGEKVVIPPPVSDDERKVDEEEIIDIPPEEKPKPPPHKPKPTPESKKPFPWNKVMKWASIVMSIIIVLGLV